MGKGTARLPVGTNRVVVAGVTADQAFVGWLADSQLVQVDQNTYIGAGCVVQATSPSTRRNHGEVTTAVVRGADAVAGASSIVTTLSARRRGPSRS